MEEEYMDISMPTYECRLVKQKTLVNKPISKIGGTPVFYEKIDWPRCKFCGEEMDFIAQICLNEPLKFPSTYDMAYIFMCPGEYDDKGWLKCETWDSQSGANTVILQCKKDTFFIDSTRYARIPDYTFECSKLEEPFIDFSDFDADEELRDRVILTTKIGGVPAWLQDNETPNCPVCGKTMKFVAQILSELDGPLDADTSKWDEQENNSLDFGGDGIGYLFICEDGCKHAEGAFLWQCT